MTAAAAVLGTAPLPQGPWPTLDPFLFCVHHHDAYPEGDGKFGPKPGFAGRAVGQDFSGKDGWSMYHGAPVPGFPRHPHRGFETVTVARQGFIDHSDSLGAAARFGEGDLQWMTAGGGVVHSEMFPLLNENAANPTELFQIWLNLPGADKMAEPHFAMSWAEKIPEATFEDGKVRVVSYAGALPDGRLPPPPPPASWAAKEASHVAIQTIALEPGASWTLPAGPADAGRCLYFFSGEAASVAGQALPARHVAQVRADAPVEIAAGDGPVEFLLLQGKPIGEPVAQHGPFVMNSREELQSAFDDYRRTEFGGWSWPDDGPVHGAEARRFARYPDGTEITP